MSELEPDYIDVPGPPAYVDPVAFAAAAYRAYRKANRPYRRAFRGIVGGERERKILLAVGESNARKVDRG